MVFWPLIYVFVVKLYLSGCYFTNIYKVHPEPCTHALLITGQRVSRTVWIICLALSSAALLKVGRPGGSPSRKFLPWPTRLEFCPGLFIFTRCVFGLLGYLLSRPGLFSCTSCVVRHLVYLLSLASKPCPFRTISWGLHSVLEGSLQLFHIWNFWSEHQSCLVNFRALSAHRFWKVCPNFLGGLPLVAGLACPYIRYCMAAFLLDHLGPLVPLWKGAPDFLEGLPCDIELCPGKSSPYLQVSFSFDKEGLLGLYSLPSDGISFVVAVFPLILYRRRG